MSNLFGNQNGPKPDEKEQGTAAPRAPFGATAEPRPPLFPRRDPDKPDSGSLFQSRTADGKDTRAPLFPKKEEPRAPLFPPRQDAAPGAGVGTAPRAPLFPSKENPERKPLFGATGTAQTPAAKPLFGAGAEAAKPMFGTRPVAQDPARPTFGAKPAAPAFGAKPATPTFGAKPAAPAFGAKPATPAKPLFGANQAAPAKPLFTATPSAPISSLGASGGADIKITDAEFILLRDFLYDSAGIYIAENRKYLLENRLASRLRELGLRNFGEYHKYLRFDANKDKELNNFFINMTTNETSFFRNGPQLDVFRDKVLKKVIDELRAKGQKKLRIWSAGCSSGEEPYTLAMIIYEVLGAEVSSWDIKITANDLSLAMLAAARRGLYNDYAIRTTSPEMLNKYFTKEDNLYRIDPKLSKLISFGQINLNDKEQLAKVEKSQIVFCRNVIIYFDDEMKKGVINAFYDNLLPGGYLLIGHSESLHNISRAFKPEHYSGSIVYCKQS